MTSAGRGVRGRALGTRRRSPASSTQPTMSSGLTASASSISSATGARDGARGSSRFCGATPVPWFSMYARVSAGTQPVIALACPAGVAAATGPALGAGMGPVTPSITRASSSARTPRMNQSGTRPAAASGIGIGGRARATASKGERRAVEQMVASWSPVSVRAARRPSATCPCRCRPPWRRAPRGPARVAEQTRSARPRRRPCLPRGRRTSSTPRYGLWVDGLGLEGRVAGRPRRWSSRGPRTVLRALVAVVAESADADEQGPLSHGLMSVGSRPRRRRAAELREGLVDLRRLGSTGRRSPGSARAGCQLLHLVAGQVHPDLDDHRRVARDVLQRLGRRRPASR